MLRIVNAARLVPLEELLAELSGQAQPARKPGPAAPAPPVAAAPSRNPAPGAGPGPSSRPRFSPASGPTASSPAPPAPPADARPSAPDAAPPTPSSERPRSKPAPAPPAPASTSEASAGEANESSSTAEASGALPEAETVGIDPAQVQALTAAILEQQKFLASLLTHVTRWEVSGNELHIYFPPEQRSLSEMLQSREPMEKLRTITNQVLGRPLRVCVKLGASRNSAAPAAKVPAKNHGSEAGSARDLRARFEQDPKVKAMLDRFGGRISRIKPAGGS